VFNSLKLRVARSPLRSPAFLRLWLGLSISYVGDQFTTIALLWFVLQLTGSGVAISLVLLCFQLPSMVTVPLLGVILDRWQPRVVMGIDNCARTLLIGTIPVLSWSGMLQLWQISALALLAFALLLRTRELRLLTSLSMVFFFSYGPLEAALPLYSDRKLRCCSG